jgi:hypothetical protein
MILAERNARVMAEANAAVVKAEAANAQADLSSSEALNAHLKLEIEKLRRALYGSRSERKARLLEQMELQLEDLETAATEDELAAETAAVRTQTVQSFQRKRPSRKPFPLTVVRHREPELLIQPHNQIARPPAHHPLDRRDLPRGRKRRRLVAWIVRPCGLPGDLRWLSWRSWCRDGTSTVGEQMFSCNQHGMVATAIRCAIKRS